MIEPRTHSTILVDDAHGAVEHAAVGVRGDTLDSVLTSRVDMYYFGRLTKEVEVFAFPRVGSHYFVYCLAGVFDLVSVAGDHLHNTEAIARQDEINELVLYQLRLREDGVPYQPVLVDPVSTGVHGLPRLGSRPVMVLMRDPMATLYSLHCVSTSRWGQRVEVWPWLRDAHENYIEFYSRASEVIAEDPARCMLLRYEQLLASPEPLAAVVRFVGVTPKLQPRFVHGIMRFDNFTRAGARTFYRAGDNSAWCANPAFCDAVQKLADFDFRPWGYHTMAAYRELCATGSSRITP